MIKTWIGFLLIILFQPLQLPAHGDLHQRILELTIEILQNPDNSLLRLKRGELYLQHEDYAEGIEDFEDCLEIGLRSERLYYNLALAHFYLDSLDNSFHYVNLVLKDDPLHSKAYELKGKIHFSNKAFVKSAQAYQVALLHAQTHIPDHFINVSRSWQLSSKKRNQKKAVKILEIGIQEFGDLIIFHEQLVDLYSAHSDWENAIHHQKIIIATSQRKEWGLFDLGELYLQMGNKKDAELSFTAAKNSIRTYPFRIQKIPAVVELDRHIEHQLKSLSTR